jgi:hypothetical protein
LTETDKAEIIGTAQLQYTDAEKQVNLLARKLRDIGKEFEKLGNTLQTKPNTFDLGSSFNFDNLNVDKALSLSQDLRDAEAKMHQFKAELAGYGINV